MSLRLEEKVVLRHVSVSFLTVIALLPSYAVVHAAPVPQLSLPAVTTVLPANTPGLVLVNAKPTAWAALDRFNPLPESLRIPFSAPFLPGAIDFTQDIQPWLGDQVAVALVPTAGSIAGTVFQTLDASAVLVAPIKDRDRFDRFLSKLKATRGNPDIEREYKGVTLLQWSASAEETSPATEEPDATTQRSIPWRGFVQPTRALLGQPVKQLVAQLETIPPASEPEEPSSSDESTDPDETPKPDKPSDFDASELLKPKGMAIALLPGNVAVAVQAQTLEDLIDARAEKEPLTQNPLFRRTLQHPHAERSLLTSYGNVAAISKFILAIVKASPASTFGLGLPTLYESQLSALTKLYSTADSHVWLQPEGIHSQVNIYYTTPRPDLATRATSDANQIMTRLPAATFLSASSRNFKEQWQTSLKESQNDPNTQLALTGFRESLRAVGLDPEKDVFPWMDGEYAFFLFPARGGLFNSINSKLDLGVGLMIQTSDRAAAELALKKLDQFVKKEAKGEVVIVPKRLKGQSIVSWEAKDRGKTLSFLSHGWVDANTLVITTGVTPMAALNPEPYLPLHLNHTFQTATASFPIPNDGYFYVNMGATLSFLYNLILPPVSTSDSLFVQEFQRIAGTVRSVSTSNSATADAQRLDSLWVLAPVKQPQ
ncbi:DUF3352 domain-containing protein [Phormidium sp. FACHB-592]|nr:DUF3352 domain-containing protein [Phormidium sp. FACHB-592]